MNHFIIDGIGPFFRYHPGGRINWSKIPFATLEKNGRIPRPVHEQICADFHTVCARASSWGYNTITLDDLAHLYNCPDYHAELRLRLGDYQSLYRDLLEIAERHGLAVWFTTDVMFYTRATARPLGDKLEDAVTFLKEALEQVFIMFPGVAGVVLRIGESDGHDVTGDFLSRLVIRSSREGNAVIRALLPVCERYQRMMIFRTWSVGAFRIGDLIWNHTTFKDLFQATANPYLIVSIKYGESDFFRFLRLSPMFAKPGVKKIIELQARREYEGMGEYPSFIGRDYAAYRDQVANDPDVVGMSVWCQTGGWAGFRRLTFLEANAVWNEINTWCCIKLFREGMSVEGAVRSYFQTYGTTGLWHELLELLDGSDEVVKSLLYLDDFANRPMYFRRLRIPPLLAVYWDHLFINGALRKLHRCFVHDGEAKIRQAVTALETLDRMKQLAGSLSLPVDDVEFMKASYRLLALARVFYLRPVTEESMRALSEAVEHYQATYGSRGYHVHLDLKAWKVSRRGLKRLVRVMIREDRDYRWIDRVFTLYLLAGLYSVTRIFHHRLMPEFAKKQAMGIDTIFR